MLISAFDTPPCIFQVRLCAMRISPISTHFQGEYVEVHAKLGRGRAIA
jgi:hypothetical protein